MLHIGCHLSAAKGYTHMKGSAFHRSEHVSIFYEKSERRKSERNRSLGHFRLLEIAEKENLYKILAMLPIPSILARRMKRFENLHIWSWRMT